MDGTVIMPERGHATPKLNDLIQNDRPSLIPENVETLVFMTCNFRAIGCSLDLSLTPPGFGFLTLSATKKSHSRK